MHRRSQFDIRENPASDRRHGSRFVTPGLTDEHRIEQQSVAPSPPIVSGNHSSIFDESEQHAAPAPAATGGGNDATMTRHRVGSPTSLRETMLRNFEPLISSYEAARLLGKIHVKTLQRYARQGNLPGYQIGGHWYFRASELDSWLRSRLNSSCHPCRLQEESDGT